MGPGHSRRFPRGKPLDLGAGKQVFYAEFDRRRKKRVIVTVIGL